MNDNIVEALNYVLRERNEHDDPSIYEQLQFISFSLGEIKKEISKHNKLMEELIDVMRKKK